MPWSLQEAKNSFSRVVDAAVSGASQLVTRHGKPALIVLAAEEYERLARLDREAGPGLGELLLTLPPDDRPFEPADLDARDVDL
jgi:prevent-host-death family protein